MILIRECEGHDELEACVRLQVETWGYDQADVIPRKAFLVMQKIGGQIIGAFDTRPSPGRCSQARCPVLQRLRTTTRVARISRRCTAPRTTAVSPSRSVPTGSSTGGTRWQDVSHVGVYLGNGWMMHSTRGGPQLQWVGGGYYLVASPAQSRRRA